jgi:hypothetical protein
MTPIAEAFKKERPDKKEYWRQNELNDKEELQALAEIIKEVYFQDYKAAYSSSNSNGNNNNSSTGSPANSPAPEKRE